MAFYTPTWVRRLVKEDHENIQKYLENTKNDFRRYIDATTPFVLWLDIGLIRERILTRSATFITELATVVSQERDVTQIITDLLDAAYVATINNFANNPAYIKISDIELEQLLTTLTNAELGAVKNTIQSAFKRTMVVTNVTKKNKSVMLIFPKFTTLDFGSVFKKELEILVNKTKKLQSTKPVAVGGMFGGLATGSGDSEKTRMLDFVKGNFASLQNIGHVEVDVVSEVDRKVLRAQNSPRLLQALMTLPNDSKRFEQLQLKFSKETGQAQTRVKVRKRFTGSKMVFEMLVEHGLAVGIPETQADNLYKAKLEKAFTIGSGLTASIRKDISILANLETSKSMVQYAVEAMVSALSKGVNPKDYTSNTDIFVKTTVQKTKVKVGNKNKSSNAQTPRLSRTVNTTGISLSSLMNLINANLAQKIKENMGDGNRRDVLNLRSGRLAESAQVERMSQSRAGMITAFYSYMRNPYGTFSDGGRQQYPRTRDPKLLIAKSIREIAAQQVGNRLRSVLV